MQSFKQYLKETENQLTDDEITKLVITNCRIKFSTLSAGNIKVLKNRQVNINAREVHIDKLNNESLPFSIKKIKTCYITNVNSVKGFPTDIKGRIWITSPYLKSLAGWEAVIDDDKAGYAAALVLDCPNLTKLKCKLTKPHNSLWINAHITDIGTVKLDELIDCIDVGILFVENKKFFEGVHLLKFLKSETLFSIALQDKSADEKLVTALEIVNKHLTDKNISACQTELFKNGLKEYAKL